MKHELTSIEDIIKVVNSENVEAFKKDFGAFLNIYLLTKALGEAAGGEARYKSFTWIDDGKHDISVKIEVAEKP